MINTILPSTGRFKATQAFMIFGLLFIGLSMLILIGTAVRPKKFIYRILSSTFFIAGKSICLWWKCVKCVNLWEYLQENTSWKSTTKIKDVSSTTVNTKEIYNDI